MSMFSESEWNNIPEALQAQAPGPAAFSMNGDGDHYGPVEPPPSDAELFADTWNRLDRVELATMLLAAGLACIALAMLVYLKRAE